MTIQDDIDAAEIAGGGTVQVPAGETEVPGLVLPANVTLQGQGMDVTTIKLANGSDTNVVTSKDFGTLTGSNKWLVSEGVPTGFGLRDLKIDGNKANNASGHGVCFYGKRYVLDRVTVINCADDGVYSECAAVGGQEGPQDLPESTLGPLYVSACDGNGVTYNGPHDGLISELFVSGCANGLVTSASSVLSGAVDLTFAHVYGAIADGVVLGAPARVGMIQIESCYERGLVATAENTTFGTVYAFRNQRQFAAEGGASHDDVSVDLTGFGVVVGTAKVRADYGGCAVRIAGAATTFQGNIFASTGRVTTDGLGLDIDGADGSLVMGSIVDFGDSGGVGVRIGADESVDALRLDLVIMDCDTPITNTAAITNSRLDRIVIT